MVSRFSPTTNHQPPISGSVGRVLLCGPGVGVVQITRGESTRNEDLRQHPRRDRLHADGAHQRDHARRDRGDRAREARDVQSRQLDQGPHRGEDDRGRRAVREAQAGRDDRRGHVRQHRHGPGDRRGREGLSLHLHHHRQAVEGEDRRAEGVRRRSDRVPDRRGSRGPAVVLLGLVAPRARDPGRLEGQSVRQPVEHATPTTSRPRPRSGIRPTARWPTSSSASAPAARSAASASTSRSGTRQVKVWGVDTYGSVFKKYKETGIFDKNEIYPYVTEGIGEDFLPGNVDFDIIDHFEKVTDKDAAHHDAAAGARGGHLGRQLRRRRDGRRGAAGGALQEGRGRGRRVSTTTGRAISARCTTTSGCARRASSRSPA